MYPAPPVYDQQIYTPLENLNQQTPQKETKQMEQSSTGSPEHPHTPEEADTPTYHPQVPEGHKQLAPSPEVQQLKEELVQLDINVIAAHHLLPILQVFPQDPPQFLAPPAPQVSTCIHG